LELKSCHKLIYKIHSKQLKKAKWNLTLDLNTAMRENSECVVALNNSQALRFIDEINGVENITSKVNHLYNRIKAEKKKQRSKETKVTIRQLYQTLYDLQFQKDYVCIIMDSNADYDRANKGFTINGVKYRRLLGTNGGIKNSTIVYVSEAVYEPLKKRMDNGRDMSKQLVPAKLEAYQALICSGSTPLPPPRGFIVVKDCITHFKDNVIMINDEADGEPVLTYENKYEIEHNDSDGYGLMSPAYSKIVNGFLTGDDQHTISGMNTRYAWTKGMVYTFDFVEFAEKIAGTYLIEDVWGCIRDVRDADVILTESMLKLWDSYDSWEDYYRNCEENHYEFSTPKITPEKLENVRDTNYQFLQSYEFSDEEIKELCEPTFSEINDALGLDYKKSLTFMTGYGLTDESASLEKYSAPIQALMIEPGLINDSFIRRKIWSMIERRIEMAKRGAIRVNGNYAMISGDPYALCQSMFGLEITGLLKAGEVYHKYWIDKGADEIVCFRAPMTCHNNIRRMILNKSVEVLHWYQYIKTALIYNAFDTACEAMNGSDKDGDTNMCTDNPILIRRTLNLPTIVCVQRKAEKKIASEDDIIQANKLAFNDDIGVITNHVTSMIERQSGFDIGSKEYETLSYRIMCGQLYQQNAIDRAKGIIAKPMPTYWYSYRDCLPKPEDKPEEHKAKELNIRIVASEKPYFMKYVYPSLKSKYNSFMQNNKYKAIRLFSDKGIRNLDDLEQYPDKTDEMREFLEHFHSHMVVGENDCVINRICKLAENEFSSFSKLKSSDLLFDYSSLKCGVEYSASLYNTIHSIYHEYKRRVEKKKNHLSNLKSEKNIDYDDKALFVEWFKRQCAEVCTNEYELCDILLDICYQTEGDKSFVWEVCGDTIVNNLLSKNEWMFSYPVETNEDSDFVFCGRSMSLHRKRVDHD